VGPDSFLYESAPLADNGCTNARSATHMANSSNAINDDLAAAGKATDAAADLVRRHYTMHADPVASRRMSALNTAALEPFLRNLLFTDGPVTRALEVHSLLRVGVEVVNQSEIRLPVRIAHELDYSGDGVGLWRRVIIRAADSELHIAAESYILPDRLPPGFVDVLANSERGIGESIQLLNLGSRRELLWFNLAEGAADSLTLTRVYRIIVDDLPAVLISEAFAVERSGHYVRLLGCRDGGEVFAVPAAPA